MRSDGYAGTSRDFVTKARAELEKGDLLQASEKLWGAAAQMVKAVAERRGWTHDSHRSLSEVVNRLAQETGDRTLRASFQIAQSLHFNFYEGVHPREFIEDSIGTVEEFLGKLERL